MLRKLSALMLAVITAFAFTGCKASSKDEAVSGTPEEIVTGYYNCLINENYTTAYEKYLSQISKAFETKEQFELRMSQNAFLDEKKLKDVYVNDAELVTGTDDVIYKISGILKYDLNGKELTEDFYEYVITQKKTGFNRILINGALSAKPYEMSGDKKTLHAESVVIYNTVEGKRAEIKMVNNDYAYYSIGKESVPPMLEVVSDGKTYAYKFSSYSVVEPGETAVIVGEYKGLSGDVSKIVLSCIYPVGQDRKPVESDNGRIYSLTLE